MAFFDFFKKKPVQNQKALGSGQANYVPVNSVGFNSNESSILNILGQQIDWKEYNKEHPDNRFLVKPDWSLWRDFYGFYNGAETVVNFVTKNFLSAGWMLYDKSGKPCKDLTDKITNYYDLYNLITKIVKQVCVYGTVFVVKHTNMATGSIEKGRMKFICVPASEILLVFGDVANLEITNFLWYNQQIRTTINIADTSGDRNFDVIKYSDLDDQYFGESPLRTYYNIIPSIIGDDDRYKLFIKNKGNTGIIVGYDIDLPENVANLIQAQMKAFRDEDIAFKAATLPMFGSTPNNENTRELIKFETIKQEFDNRITPAERDMFDQALARSFGVHPRIIGYNTGGGIGSSEYEPAMQMFKNVAFEPIKTMLETKLNDWIIKEILTDYENKVGFLDDYKITVDEQEVNSEIKDFTFKFGELDYELNSAKRDSYLRAFQLSLFTAKEIREKGFGVNDEIGDEFDYKVLPSNLAKIDDKNDTALSVQNNNQEKENLDDTDIKGAEENKKESDILDKVDNNSQELINNDNQNQKASRPFKITLKQKKRIDKFLKAHSDEHIDNLPSLKEFGTLKTSLYNSLVNQYRSSKVKNQKSEMDSNIQINQEDYTLAMLFFASLGQAEVIRQLKELGIEYNSQAEFNETIKKFISDRLTSLLGGQVDTPTLLAGIVSPVLKNGLDEESLKVITQILKEAQENDWDEERILEEIDDRADTRAGSITTNEAGFLYSMGSLLATDLAQEQDKNEMITKTWKPTSSTEPRLWHSKTVGTTIPYKDYFVHGNGEVNFWSGEAINCRCQIKLGKKTINNN